MRRLRAKPPKAARGRDRGGARRGGDGDGASARDDLPRADAELFERLRRRRAEIAREQQVPPYVVFHDAVLLAIVAAKPSGDADLVGISGIGDAKRRRYGADMLAVVADWRAEQ